MIIIFYPVDILFLVFDFKSNLNFDGLVKSQKSAIFVIPAKAVIQ